MYYCIYHYFIIIIIFIIINYLVVTVIIIVIIINMTGTCFGEINSKTMSVLITERQKEEERMRGGRASRQTNFLNLCKFQLSSG